MRFILTIFFIFSATLANAATYYVRTDGNNGNSGTANSSGGAWRTIDYAAGAVRAGDVVRVQAGSYGETVTPSVSGTGVDNTITFVADGTVTTNGFSFSGQDYIRVIGFNFSGTAANLSSGISTGIEFWNCTSGNFTNSPDTGGRGSASSYYQNSLFIGNKIINGSNQFDATGLGCLYAYNEATGSREDFFRAFSQNSIWENNYSHSKNIGSGHADFIQSWSNPIGYKNSLIESNMELGQGVSNEHFTNISNTSASTQCSGSCGEMTNNLYRFNVIKGNGNGAIGTDNATNGPISYNVLYQNTFAEVQQATSSATYGVTIWDGANYNYIRNNIFYNAWGRSVSSSIRAFYTTGTTEKDYNLAYDPDGNVSFLSDWTSQAHEQSNANPYFNNYSQNDLTIASNSLALDNGGPLTTVSGSGTGTTFSVKSGDGVYFRGDYTNLTQYGGNLSVGDTITVGTDEVTISSISGDTITVTKPFTWADGDPVYFGTDSTPDIGAYPYKSAGYSLSGTYSLNSGTVTVTPDDASLVRWVVVFEDGIPVGVANSSPYSISGVGNGTLDVRIYPRYASPTLYVKAAYGENTGMPAMPAPQIIQITPGN